MTVILSFLLSMIGTKMSIRLAFKMKTLDYPNEIKIHTSPIPTLGGLGILGGSLISSLLMVRLGGYSYSHVIPVFAGALVIFIVGLVDDIRVIAPTWKVLGQVSAALTYVVAALLLLPTMHVEPWLIGSELLWVMLLTVGLSNSFNLFDGMDGVLAGMTAIMAISGSAVARINANPFWSIVLLAVAGSCMGFLVFNLPPAKTFMGDCGSLYLGYILGIAVYQLAFCKTRPAAHVFAWLTILALPICDTAFAIMRRVVSHSGLFMGDRRHIYDMLCKHLKGNVLKTALVIWCVTAILGVLGVWIAHMADFYWTPVAVAVVYLILFYVGNCLGCLDID